MKKTLLLFLIFFHISIYADVKVVVFDFGGVIAKIDREKIIDFLKESFQQTEKELKPALNQWKTVLQNNADEEIFWQNYAKSLGIILPKGWYQRFKEVNSFIGIPGMIEIVKDLREDGYQVAMLSNIQEYQANVVRKFNYYELFSPVLLSYEIGFEKPSKEAYLVLLDRLQCQPHEVLFIDDQKENVEGALKVGIEAILFTSSEELIQKLEILK